MTSNDGAVSLIEHAKRSTEDAVAQLTEPDEDVMPMFLWNGAQGFGIMPIGALMKGDAEKNYAALLMTSVMVVGRADEAVHISASWLAEPNRNDVDDLEWQRIKHGYVTTPVSERPDRIEAVTVMHATTDGDTLLSAEIIRHPDKPPQLGEWKTRKDFHLAGRFGNAMHNALKMVELMPPDMVAMIEEGYAAGQQQELIDGFMRAALSSMLPEN